MMQMVEDNMSESKFLITEYTIQLNQMNKKHTFARCYCFLVPFTESRN